MEEMEKNHDGLLTGAHNELKKEMAMLQKQIMMETVSYYTYLKGINRALKYLFAEICITMFIISFCVNSSSKRWQVFESLFNPCYSDDSEGRT